MKGSRGSALAALTLALGLAAAVTWSTRQAGRPEAPAPSASPTSPPPPEMRPPRPPEASATSIPPEPSWDACCRAFDEAARTAELRDRGLYIAAESACQAFRRGTRQDLKEGLTKLLAGRPLPHACRDL